jgi:PadR family transcriptional regulator, regulatory protein PadR
MQTMVKTDGNHEVTEKLTLELRRGILVLAVLTQLAKPQYGYSLMQRLTERGLTIDQGTLYPLLRRLEDQGLLGSEWQVEEARPRRYYVISEKGAQVLRQLAGEWQSLVGVMDQLLHSEDER